MTVEVYTVHSTGMFGRRIRWHANIHNLKITYNKNFWEELVAYIPFTTN
jgi:hypothetical protein